MDQERESKIFKKYFWLYGAIALVVVVSLVVSIGILAKERNEARSRLEAVYERSFYDLVADVNDIEIKLDKLSVSNSPSYQRELLAEVSARADLAEASVAQLSSGGGSLEGATKYINQLADYTKSLTKKLAEGESLTSEEKEALKSLAEVSRKINLALLEMRGRITKGYFISDGGEAWSDFDEMEETSIDYPELIYDGPFADSVINKEPAVTGKPISGEEGVAIAERASGERLQFSGEWEGKIKTLNYMSEDGKVHVKLTESGTLFSYSSARDGSGEQKSESECIEIAREYAEKNGFSDLVPVWVSNYSGMIFVNLVYEQNDVICYNDMVKVKVDSDSGRVVGFDSQGYLYNHIARNIPPATITEEQAISMVYKDITPQSVRLALIPKNGKERLTYEVFGEIEGKKYFIYLDSVTGEELNILCVIDSDEGELLM